MRFLIDDTFVTLVVTVETQEFMDGIQSEGTRMVIMVNVVPRM